MADEIQQPGAADQPEAGQSEIPEWVKDPTKAYAEIKKARAEAASHRTKANEFEQRLSKIEQDRAALDEKSKVQNGEWQKLAEERAAALKEIESKATAESMKALKLEVALDLGLPKALAMRLQGTSREELEADAESLKALIPTTTGSGERNQTGQGGERPRSTTSAVPGGPPAGETDAQKKARLLGGTRNNVFAGGGVRINGEDI